MIKREKLLEHIKEFSRHANSYDSHTVIQKEVATHLTCKIKNNPKKVLDLGCGSGAIHRNMKPNYELFIGVDNSANMCELHPKGENTIILNQSFESEEFFKYIKVYAPLDLIVSSSALQWSKNLNNVIKSCKTISDNILFSIFTKGTFKSIYEMTQRESFLPSVEEVVAIVSKYYDIDYEVKKYKLEFDDNISKFRYIKRSGVSGGKKELTLIQTKELIKNYPYSFLEFEVVFISSK